MVRQQARLYWRRVSIGCVVAGLVLAAGSAAAQDPIIRTYDVQFTDAPPTIDGVASPGEWDAAPEEGDFLVVGPAMFDDLEDSAFRAMWDQDNFYLLLTGRNLSGFTQRPAEDNPAPDFSGATANWNIYWDPNLDDDPNLPDPLPPEGFSNANDGYQIAFGQHEGESIMQGDNQGGNFLFTEAHVNAGFGNHAMWRPGLGEIVIAQNNTFDSGVAEVAIPWTEINALAEIDDGMGGLMPTGLHHPFAPSNGDVWFVQLSRYSLDPQNQLPIWNWTPSGSFTSHPHGEFTFVGAPDVGELAGDYNGNGRVEQADLDLVLLNWGTALAQPWVDGTVDQAELDGVLLNWGNEAGLGSAAGVPEPGSCVLFIMVAAAGVAIVCRRTR